MVEPVVLDCAGFGMHKYAMIKDNIVHTVFETKRPMSDFPDIEKYLMNVTDQDVECNYKFENGNFSKPIELVTEESAGFFAKIINFFKSE